LCHSHPIYAFTSYQLVSLTLATFLRAEFGFLGVIVVTFVHTHLFKGFPLLEVFIVQAIEFLVTCRAGALLFTTLFFLLVLTN
jgi:hypothetical protein